MTASVVASEAMKPRTQRSCVAIQTKNKAYEGGRCMRNRSISLSFYTMFVSNLAYIEITLPILIKTCR